MLLQKERDAHGNYYGGISLDGMMFKIPKMYTPVTDETGRITAFRQMREQDFSSEQPQKQPEKTPSIRAQLAKADNFQIVADIFKQVGDPTRVRIFWLLCHCEECVQNISALMEMSSPAVSHHLRGLKDNGLIVSRRVGKEDI